MSCSGLRTLLVTSLITGLMTGLMACAPLKPATQEQPKPEPTPASPSPVLPSLPAVTPTPAPTTPDPTSPAPEHVVTGPVLGGDVSWPQCPKGMGIEIRQGEGKPMPIDEARFVILGLTNGPAFYRNPCLESQYSWAKARKLHVGTYAVAMYPGPEVLATHGSKGPFDAGTPLGRLRNVGHADATFNIETMRSVGIKVPLVWIDVEPYPLFPWSPDPRANAAVVEGLMRGYREAGYRIGVYSNQGLWRTVLGTTRLGLPEWRATGPHGRDYARSRCDAAYSFQGGEPFIVQWVEDERDQNLTCATGRVPMGRWFATP